jgi:hypothetical protein
MLQPKIYAKDKKKVYDTQVIDYKHKTVIFFDNETQCTYTRLFSEVEFMENTGLKDKHGKYIYEGDIVTVNGTWNCIIEYEQSSCAFVLKSIDSRWSTGYFSNYDDIEEMLEVIGNIYENKDLLGVR